MLAMAEPSDKWMSILTTQGLAVLLVLFGLFVVTPAVSYYSIKGARWIGSKVVDFMERIATTAEQSVKTQDEIKTLIVGSGFLDNKWHEEKIARLEQIKDGVEGLHGKVDAVHDIVNRKFNNRGGHA